MSLTELESGFLTGGAVLGIRGSPVSREIIVSRENGQIQVYNMEGGCCVKSWQLSSSQTLSSPVVQHSLTRVYWAVINGTELLSWRFSDSSLSQFPQGLPSSVHTLLVARGNKSPVAVLSNGTVCLIEEQPIAAKNESRVLMADTVVRGAVDDVCVVCSCEGVIHVTVWAVGSECVNILTSAILDKSDLTGFCVCQNKLLATGDHGDVHSWLVDEGVKHSASVSTGSRPIKSLIVAISDYFVTYDGHSLLLWEPDYMTQQAMLKVDNITKLHSCGRWVCDGVRVWRVKSGQCGLSAALGKSVPQPTTHLLSWDKQECVDCRVLDKLTDRTQTPSIESFMAEFSSCPLTSDLCYSDLLERLLSEGEFWAREALEKLARMGAVPLSLSDRLLCEACARKDWELMNVCLECVGGFTECVIVKLVEQLLSDSDDNIDSSHRQQLLHLLLCQPFNDALLQQPLSQLKHTTVQELLQFLSGQLSVGELLARPPPAYNSMLDWVGQVIDVHFAQLTFDPTSRDILAQLQCVVRDQVTCWSRLGVVRGVMGAWPALSNAPSANGWLYRVETVDIDL